MARESSRASGEPNVAERGKSHKDFKSKSGTKNQRATKETTLHEGNKPTVSCVTEEANLNLISWMRFGEERKMEKANTSKHTSFP